jgi:hypothetical protein
MSKEMKKLNKITCSEDHFYGYIKGLRIDIVNKDYSKPLMIATFHYNYEEEDYLVEDFELFAELLDSFKSMGYCAIENNEWGYEKLWIQYKKGEWRVLQP